MARLKCKPVTIVVNILISLPMGRFVEIIFSKSVRVIFCCCNHWEMGLTLEKDRRWKYECGGSGFYIHL